MSRDLEAELRDLEAGKEQLPSYFLEIARAPMRSQANLRMAASQRRPADRYSLLHPDRSPSPLSLPPASMSSQPRGQCSRCNACAAWLPSPLYLACTTTHGHGGSQLQSSPRREILLWEATTFCLCTALWLSHNNLPIPLPQPALPPREPLPAPQRPAANPLRGPDGWLRWGPCPASAGTSLPHGTMANVFVNHFGSRTAYPGNPTVQTRDIYVACWPMLAFGSHYEPDEYPAPKIEISNERAKLYATRLKDVGLLFKIQ
ncbi:hypothetical protein B0H16DRAFT_1487045, partial [Mycena metata]